MMKTVKNLSIFLLLIIILAPLIAKDSVFVSIAFVGDIMVSESPPDSGKCLLAEAKPILEKADITIGNLEGVLCDSCHPRYKGKNAFNFRMPEYFADVLRWAGFDVMHIGNNHIRDFGDDGLRKTKRILTRSELKYIGLRGDVVNFRIKSVNVSIVGFSVYKDMYSLLDSNETVNVIRKLSKDFDILIVSFHGGREGKDAYLVPDSMEYFFGEPRGNLIKFSRWCIDNGADLVVGHGPHTPRKVELYKNRLIAYSLGNFCTWKRIKLNDNLGYAPLLWVELGEDGRFISGKIYSYVQYPPGGVRVDPENRAYRFMIDLSGEEFLKCGEFNY